MRKIIFREGFLIDRVEEENFIINRVYDSRPESILFIYGPKSSGKTTLIEYIVEEKLQKDKKFYVNYVNFRGYAIHSYDSFLNIYFYPIREDSRGKLSKMMHKFGVVLGNLKGDVRIPQKGIDIGISFNLYEALKNREADPFKLILEVLKKLKEKGRRPVLIIDEIQELSDIYMNGDIKSRYLLTEFFKFLIRLTKETHICHVFVVTSSSVFIDEIYNNSKLAKTSEFYLIDHFDYNTTKEWLSDEGFNPEEIELIWEYLGGCPFDIISLISNKKNLKEGFDLKKYLKEQAMTMRGKIEFTIGEIGDIDLQEYFEEMMRVIVKEGYIKRNVKDVMQNKVLKIAIEKDILFLKSGEGRIIFNSHIMKKGAEVYLESIS